MKAADVTIWSFLHAHDSGVYPSTIHAVVMRDGEWWVAQLLETAVATQARTLDELHAEVRRILDAHFECCAEIGQDPFEMQAPEQFWKIYREMEP